MAQSHSQSSTTDEVSALATSLNEILKVQDEMTKGSSTTHSQQNHRNSKIFDIPYQIPVTASTLAASSSASSSSSIISSSQLSLIQFTLTVSQTGANQQVGIEKNKAGSSAALSVFDAGNSHVLLHLDENSALASSSSSSCMEQVGAAGIPGTLGLEIVDLALISDKFPLDTIPVQRFPKDAIFLMKFWADINFTEDGSQTAGQFQVSTIFESPQLMSISCKTSVCSFGRSIGDKIEKLSGIQVTPNRVLYQSVGAPLCDYLVNFIRKLKGCGNVATMNGVLENFTVIQVVSNDVTGEVLLCFLHIFEVCPPELSATTGAMCNVYRLDCTAK